MPSPDPAPTMSRRLRIRTIRRHMAAATAAVFALAFGLIAGNGSLGAASPPAHATTKAGAGSVTNQAQAAPVTTQQS